MRITLKVDVEDTAGFRQGLPALLKLFDNYNVQATFMFALGYDNTGLRLKNLYNPLILSRQLPLLQKIYGTLLPPVSIGKKYKQLMQSCQAAGHDVGIKSFDSVLWRFQAADEDWSWTERYLQWSVESFTDIFGFSPQIHSASGFTVNQHLFELEQQYGFNVALDTRGKTAYLPAYLEQKFEIPQLPVTLPSVEELLVSDEVNLDNVHEYLFVESQKQLPQGHIFEVRAAHEGRNWIELLEKMIVMWRGSQWEFNRVSDTLALLSVEQIPRHQVGWAQYPPARQYMATQGVPL